jgi:hypothetical protein
MDESDYGTFERAFGRASGAFRVKFRNTSEQTDLSRTYFRALESFRLDLVLHAFKTCLAKCRTFPKIVDVLAVLEPPTATCPPDRRQMSVDEAAEHWRATLARYHDDPCGCLLCQAAGVTDRPLRFVPTVVDGQEERAFNPTRKVVEVVGHWAHGEELRQWYETQEAFGAKLRVVTKKYPHLAFQREPGQEG